MPVIKDYFIIDREMDNNGLLGIYPGRKIYDYE